MVFPEQIPVPTAPDAPQPLWKILEDEFRAMHQDAVGLDSEYEAVRDEAIRQARKELKETLRERAAKAKRPEMNEAELEEAAHAEEIRKPELINGPACKELFRRVHRFVEADEKNATRHSAICLSGGGIRSATFALGVLQGLARKGVLEDFAWLSTVSGGGYIGAWLSSWISRRDKDSLAVFRELGRPEHPADHLEPQAVSSPEPKHPFATEPAPIQHLRQYSNYLTPALGIFSGDGWSVLATVARNLLLNWLLIIPALMLVLLLSRFALCIELLPVGRHPAASIVAALLAFVTGVYALANLVARGGWTQKAVLTQCIAPLVGFSGLVTLSWFWARTAWPGTGFYLDDYGRASFYMAWGALTAILAAWMGALISGPRPEPVKRITWLWRVLCMEVVFALTGLAACWIGDKAAVCFERAETMRLTELAAARAPVTPVAAAAPAAKSVAWAWLSRDQEHSALAAWVPVPAEQVAAKKFPSMAVDGPPALTSAELRLKAAILCVCFGFPLLLTLIFLANSVITGLLSGDMRDADREWLSRASGWAFLAAVLFCAMHLIVLRGPDWLVLLWLLRPRLISLLLGSSGLLTILGGRSDRMAATDRSEQQPDWKERVFSGAVKLAAPVFVIILVMFVSLLTTLLLQKMSGQDADPTAHWAVLQNSRWYTLLAAGGLFAAVTVFGSWLVNINKFSLHAMYRNRLLRAYLGATNRFRAPNLFTGFDAKDNFEMSRLSGQRPFHVVNTALNLVGGKELAWQQRMAMSFTITPLSCGSATLGYRPSCGYAVGQYQQSMTLGTALAISGAAVSPNHGYNSSPLIAFLLTFFNARLGAWFGNPGIAGAGTWTRASPAFALWPLVYEAFGLTDSDHPYVYLSDGGHFENLGLYEMVLRRCRTIVVSDAGCDPHYWFEDLGNAISRIRVDFGIRIVFEKDIEIRKYGKAKAEGSSPGRHCAVGTIYYSEVDGPAPDGKCREGKIIYLKPAICGNEPMDVFHYQQEHPDFPHEPTTDQWFSESQFESYRALGYHTVDRICGVEPMFGLPKFIERAESYLKGAPDTHPDEAPQHARRRPASRRV